MVQDFLRCPSIPQRIENLVVGPQYLGLTECMGRIMSNLSAGICSNWRFAIIERDMGSSSSGSTVTAWSIDSSPIDIITVHGPLGLLAHSVLGSANDQSHSQGCRCARLPLAA